MTSSVDRDTLVQGFRLATTVASTGKGSLTPTDHLSVRPETEVNNGFQGPIVPPTRVRRDRPPRPPRPEGRGGSTIFPGASTVRGVEDSVAVPKGDRGEDEEGTPPAETTHDHGLPRQDSLGTRTDSPPRLRGRDGGPRSRGRVHWTPESSPT